MKFCLFVALVGVSAVSAVSLPTESCRNTHDAAILKSRPESFYSTLNVCAVSSSENAAKTATCLAKKISLSPQCSTCFGDDVGCTATQCAAAQCLLNPASQACLDCFASKCQPALVSCSGIAAADLPVNYPTYSCRNTYDAGILRSHPDDFHSILKGCAVSSLGNAAKTATCLEKAISLSSGCSYCFAKDVGCTATQCAAQCHLSPDSQACLDCSASKCQPALVTCSGIAAADLPKALPPVQILKVLNATADGCNNAGDKAVFADTATLNKEISDCAHSAFGNAAKTATCLAGKTDLSSACCTCFGDDVGCTASKCAAQCLLSPDSQSCRDCSASKCAPAFETCAGVPLPQ